MLIFTNDLHLSGVNYNTIGDAGEEFLSKLSQTAHVKVNTTLNLTGFDTPLYCIIKFPKP